MEQKIKVEKLSQEQLEQKEVFSWPIWEKEVSEFPWSYNQVEECYLLSGQVTITTESGQIVSFGVGDYVIFPQGLNCTWKITEPVKKHYRFG